MTRWILFLFFCFPVSAWAQQPSDWKVLFSPPDSMMIGDTLSLSVERGLKPGYRWSFRPDSLRMKNWELLPPSVLTDSAGWYRWNQQFVFWGIKPDTLTGLIFTLKRESDSVWFDLPTTVIFPNLITAPADTTPRPEKDIYLTYRPWWQWALMILAGLVVLALITGAILWYRNRKKAVMEQEPSIVAMIDPYQVFSDGMTALQARRSDWMANIKGFYTDLIDLLKSYLESVTGKPVREMTSDELIVWLSGEPELQKKLPDMMLLLSRADLIKFARQSAADEQMLSDFEAVRQSAADIQTGRTATEAGGTVS